MRDPIDELSRFDPGPTMNQLPAAEVRRRGTRLRRRNTTLTALASAAAIAVVAVPVASLAGHDSSSEPQPAPPSHSWVQEVPDGFPLDTGFPTPSTETTRPDAGDVPTCANWPTRPHQDQLAVRYTGESEDHAQRWLVVYADQATAADELAALRQATTGCEPVPSSPGSDLELRWDPVAAPEGTGAEDTYAYAQQVHQDDGLISDLTLVEVFRTGNALLFDSGYGSAGGPQVVEDELDRRTSAVQQTVAAMCVFSASGCDTSSQAVDPTPSGTAVTTIAADFPLLDGLPTTAATKDFGRYGPRTEKEPMSVAGCRDDAGVSPGDTVERLGGGWTDPAEQRVRQLMTFASPDDASAYLDRLETATTCSPQDVGDGVTEIHSGAGSDLHLGDEAQIAVTWYRVDGKPSPGFRITEWVRVGNAVLVQTRTADGYDDPVTSAYLEQLFTDSDQSLAGVVDAMCVYSADGC